MEINGNHEITFIATKFETQRDQLHSGAGAEYNSTTSIRALRSPPKITLENYNECNEDGKPPPLGVCDVNSMQCDMEDF